MPTPPLSAGPASAVGTPAGIAIHASRSILVLNGPNLNRLGKREPHLYGGETLADVEASCRSLGAELGLAVDCRQTNAEFQLVDWIHEACDNGVAGIVINPAAFSHTSVAVLDAL